MATGRSDREQGDDAAALKAFAAADALMHVPTTGLELARTQEALGLLVEARDTALRVARIEPKGSEPAAFTRARRAALALSDDIEPRIPSMIVAIEGVPEDAVPTLLLDGVRLPVEIVGQPYKLDPGHHVVVAEAGGGRQKAEIDVSERQAYKLIIELPGKSTSDSASPPAAPGRGGAEAARAPTAPAALTSPAATSPSPPRSVAWRLATYGGFAVGATGILVGSIAGALSWSKTSAIRSSSACVGNQCDSTAHDDIATASALATISTWSFVAAAAGVGIGVVGLLSPRPVASAAPASPVEGPRPSARVDISRSVDAWIGVTSLGLRGRF